ncbi:MAG: hypothetical protein ACOVQ6_04170 [Brevundimonas sp.]
MPMLAERFTVVAPDLPGHGFTAMPGDNRQSLWDMARRTTVLMETLQIRPSLVVAPAGGATTRLGRSCWRSCRSVPAWVSPFGRGGDRPSHVAGRTLWRGADRGDQRRAPALRRACRAAVPGAGDGAVRQSVRGPPVRPGCARSRPCGATDPGNGVRHRRSRGRALRPPAEKARPCGGDARHDGQLGHL